MGYLMSLLEVKRTTGNGDEDDLDTDQNKDEDSDYNLNDETENDPDTQHDITDGVNNYNLGDETDNTPDPDGDENSDDGSGDNPDNSDSNEISDANAPDDNEHDITDGANNYNLGDETNNTPDSPDGDENSDDGSGDNLDDPDTNYNLGDETGNDPDSTTPDDNSIDGDVDSTDGQPVDPDAKIKEIEQSIGTLNPEQLKVQNVNLKKQYIELYNNYSNIITRLNDVNKKSETEEALSFAIQSVQDLKSIIYDYLIHTYDTKTFIQNSVNYTEYLVTLNSVNKLLDNLNTNKIVNNVKK